MRDGTYGTLATLKKNKDIEGWMKEAETLVALYDAKLQDPDITSKEKRELEGKKRSLEDSMSKYASYGGFTKGSSKSKKIKLNTSGITTTKLSATKPSAPSAGTMPSKYAKLQVKKGNPNVKFTSLRGAATGTKKKGARILRGKKYGA